MTAGKSLAGTPHAAPPPADRARPAGKARPGGAALLLAAPAAGLLVALLAHVADLPGLGSGALVLATGVVLAALLIDALRSLLAGRIGLDLLAALAMGGAFAVGEALAAAVVALMYSGGRFLEARAERRATRELTALLARAPRRAFRYQQGGVVQVLPEDIAPGDRLLVKRGEALPVDGRVTGGTALVDVSTLSGEAMPVRVPEGGAVLSGAMNVGDAFDLVAEARASESAFAGILRLVEAARAERAPMARLADRYALGFLALALAIAGAAWWISQDAVRAVAVLVIATPCPLILAVPVALTAGLSRAAAAGVLVKGAGALEALSAIRTVVLDKTGTLTEGRPGLVSIEPEEGFDAEEVLRLAASLETVSQHPMALALVAEARARGLTLERPREPAETPGEGVAGILGGRSAVVGGRAFVLRRTGGAEGPSEAPSGRVEVVLAVEGRLAGRLLLADPLRESVPAVLARLRGLGVRRLVLATGDAPEIARLVARGLGLDAVEAGMDPARKAALVAAERRGGPVLMVGDGVNDAPALAVADVGVAMGARGAAASAETADIVILRDRLDPLAESIGIARHSRRIALQSVLLGMGLSIAGMLAAAAGLLRPVEGALLQEAIDVAAILNALRALSWVAGGPPAPDQAVAEVSAD